MCGWWWEGVTSTKDKGGVVRVISRVGVCGVVLSNIRYMGYWTGSVSKCRATSTEDKGCVGRVLIW